MDFHAFRDELSTIFATKAAASKCMKKEKDANMGTNVGPANGMKGLPGVIDNMKIGSVMGSVGKALGPRLGGIGNHLTQHGGAYDLAGLGLLAAPSAANLTHAARSRMAGKPVDKKEVGHSLAEIGGLGLIAAPVAAGLLTGRGH